MKTIYFCTFLSVLLAVSSCKKKTQDENKVVLGQLDVDLNANEAHIRTQESLIGNFICDAVKSQMEAKNMGIDFVVINSGAIRFDIETRPDGIYPKGEFTSEMVDEMLPFSENFMMKTEVTGLQIKEIVERSLAQLPLDKGSFLQFSKEIHLTADLSKQAQILDETVSPPVIVTPGQRLVSITLNGIPLSDTTKYRIGASDYICKGNDGFVTFLSIPDNKKTCYTELQTNLVRDAVILQSPVKPVIEGRITF